MFTIVVTSILYFNVEHVFRKVPVDMLPTARLLLLMVGSSVAISFPLGVFGGFLEGLQRFYILNWSNIAATLLRTALIFVVLNKGYGLVTLAFITIVLPLIAAILRAVIALRLRPVPIGLRYVDKSTFRRIANYSSSSVSVFLGGGNATFASPSNYTVGSNPQSAFTLVATSSA